ncbi:MAG TPA: hypothetical protein VIW29_02280 [Polyangiaceae bacterium]
MASQQIFAMGGGPAFQRLIQEGMPGGVAADDGVGLHFVDGHLHRVVSSRPQARAYRVTSNGGSVQEQPLEAELLKSEAL